MPTIGILASTLKVSTGRSRNPRYSVSLAMMYNGRLKHWQVVKTKADDDFLSDLLGEVDSNIPEPAPPISKAERSGGGRRKARALSPAPEPISKKTKILDTRKPSPPPVLDEDDSFINSTDGDLLGTLDIPMSDPAPSSPAEKVALRKAQLKQDQDGEDDEDMMEVAHAGAIATTSVNMASSRPIKKLFKAETYPTPASSSPVKANGAQVDSTSWNALTERLNVVSSSPAETKTIGKIDYKDAIEDDGSLNFFWTDYTELNGSLCLFGKVLNKKTKSYVSCFVKVDNILRKLYFLPRDHRVQDGEDTGEAVEMMQVYDEIDTMMTKMSVGMYKIKACTRKYAFELRDVPREAQYMKLLYPYTSKSQYTSGSQTQLINDHSRARSRSQPARRDLFTRLW